MGSAAGGFSAGGTVWSLGPLAVSLPIFDGGTRRAEADAARARYDATVQVYAGRLREAVREVEEVLLDLHSSALRERDLEAAAAGFQRAYDATRTRQRAGVATLFELEDARRMALIAQSALIELQRERIAAWIALYRSLGGGWTTEAVRHAAS
jgi:outer membrane protein TolC